MASTVALRRATSADYEAYCDLMAEADLLHRRRLPRIFQPAAGPARSHDSYLTLLGDAKSVVILAEADGEPVGCLVATLRDTPEVPIVVPRRVAIIDSLAVTRTWRRLGIGSALMMEAERWARTQGATDLELSVYQFNRGARAFYRSLGYHTLYHRLIRPLTGED